MKIAILGTENSHAKAFAELIRDDGDFAGIEIVGAYGYDDAANQKLLDAGLVTRFAKSPDEFTNEVDGVLVTARHGDHHYEYALPYIKAGKAAFIDKPFTVKKAYSDELISEAKKSGALICGGSSLKFLRELDEAKAFIADKHIVGGHVNAPVSMVNDYAGFYFYAQHLIEMMTAVFGYEVRTVLAYCPDQSKNRLSVIFDYGEYDVTANYTASYEYAVTVLTDKASCRIATFSLGDCYKRELTEFTEMVKTGVLPHALNDLVKPVTLLHAVQQSYAEGHAVKVEY